MTISAGAAETTAVASPSGDLTHGDLRADALELRGLARRAGPVGLVTTDAGLVAAALVALDGWASEVHLLGHGVGTDRLPPGAPVIGDDDVPAADARGAAGSGTPVDRDVAEEAAPDAETTAFVVYTSGTTGVPKAVRHTIATLSRTVVRTDVAGALTWGLLYDPNRMAGLQVLLQSLASGSTVVATDPDRSLAARLAELSARGVDALSATPTLWRLILQLPDVGVDLRQITLGGEIADQLVLDALARRFPGARIVHVFASTETGAAFSVRDGREGFPVEYLHDPPRGVRLAIRDGVLHVHSPGSSAAGPDGFASTGDVVEVVDGRVLFRGRASGVVNVGGANVWPEEVEGLLRTHPEVQDAVVVAKPNPMSGNVLVATVVPTADATADGLGKRVRAWARGHMENTHVPAMVKVVEALDVSPTGKAVR